MHIMFAWLCYIIIHSNAIPLVDTWTPGYTPVINITDELKWWINQSWYTVVRNIPHKQNETGFWIFFVCFLLLLLFFSYFSSFLASFPLILLPTINLSLLQHCTCKFCTYMYCIFFIVDHILIFFTVHAFNLPVSTLLFNNQDKGKVQARPPASLQSRQASFQCSQATIPDKSSWEGCTTRNS